MERVANEVLIFLAFAAVMIGIVVVVAYFQQRRK